MTVVGEAGDGRVAVDVVRRLRPDVVLMDIRMPELDGLRAAEAILGDDDLATAVIMLTTFDRREYVYDALRMGASGFLLKDAPAARLLDAIRVAAAGDALLEPSITRALIEQFAHVAAPAGDGPPEAVAALTARELEVLRLVARGLSNAEIAAELVLGEQTVKTHVGRMLGKLGLRDRVQAVVLAYETGLARPRLAAAAPAGMTGGTQHGRRGFMELSSRKIYFFGALGGLLFGYDTGVISGAILFIKEDFDLSPFMEGAVVASLLLGAMLGAGLAGPLSDRLGPQEAHRRRGRDLHGRRAARRARADHRRAARGAVHPRHRRRLLGARRAALPVRGRADGDPRRDLLAEPAHDRRRHPRSPSS